MTLTGNPHWQSGDGLSSGTARVFVLDQAGNTFQAQQEAHFRLPATGATETGFLLTPAAAATNAPAGAARFADVDADKITLELPPTNGPAGELQSMLAEGNVVILDEASGGRATGDRATGAGGALELTGHAQWQSGEVLARAESLAFDRTTQGFAARTNAFLRFPASALKGSSALGGLASAGRSRSTNGFVEVTANNYDYQNDLLGFHEKVKAAYSEDNAVMGTLESDALAITTLHSNQVRRIVAERDVRLRQPPGPDPRGNTVAGEFKTQHLEVQMRTNEYIESAHAAGGVTGSRTQTPAGGGETVHLTLTGDTLNATFLPETNMVDMAVVEGNVRLARDDATALADKGTYTSANDTAILTGNPQLQMPDRHMDADDRIIYYHNRNVFRAEGHPHVLAEMAVGGTNPVSPLLPPNRSAR